MVNPNTPQQTITGQKRHISHWPLSLLKALHQFMRLLLYGARKGQKYQDRALILAERQVLCGAIGTFAVLVPILIAAILGVGAVLNKLNTLLYDVKQNRFEITFPHDGADAGLGLKVSGQTPYLDRNHYILVTTVSNKNRLIQEKRVEVNPDGSFSGEAKFGDLSVGEDDEYKIQVFATKATDFPKDVPADAIFTPEAVTVRRTQPTGSITIDASTLEGEVDADLIIKGRTSFTGYNHYITVTPATGNTAVVQAQPARVNPDGSFSGNARLGGAGVGAGGQFTIQVIATHDALPAGPLPDNLTNIARSNSVTVRRK
ncbi:MAG TPA: hypothetical protein VGC89_13175 [Pyrinomonadaceae bacterium]